MASRESHRDYARMAVEELAEHVRAHVSEVQRLYVPLPPRQLGWTTNAARWSAGQCLHHLVVTDRLYLDRLTPAIAKAREERRLSAGPHPGGWFGRWFTAQVGPVISRKQKSPSATVPAPAATVPADVAETFVIIGTQLLALMDEARGLDLQGARIRSPILPVLRLRIIDALRVVVAHQRRHLDQARRMLDEAGVSNAPAD